MKLDDLSAAADGNEIFVAATRENALASLQAHGLVVVRDAFGPANVG
jgi:hypothetical protein